MPAKPEFTANDFRIEICKAMPGYDWTVHKSRTAGYLEATGKITSGFNRLSTLSIVRTERDDKIVYTSKSAGFGLRAKWLHTNSDGTLARSLRGLQEFYEHMENTYGGHARALKNARTID